MSLIGREATLYLADHGVMFSYFVREVIDKCKTDNISNLNPRYLMFNDVTMKVHKESKVEDLCKEYDNRRK